MSTMKKSFAVVVAGTLAAASAPAQVVLPDQSLGDLRSVLKQAGHSAGTASPRQLSPEERAELRRQLSQQQPKPARRAGKGA